MQPNVSKLFFNIDCNPGTSTIREFLIPTSVYGPCLTNDGNQNDLNLTPLSQKRMKKNCGLTVIYKVSLNHDKA